MSTEKLTRYGMLTAAALVAAFIESLLPLNFVPGIKLGLANCVPLLLFYFKDYKGAVTVNILRVLLAALLFGSVTSLIYSVSGAALSLFVMFIAVRLLNGSTVFTSVLGAVAHNIAQLLAAVFVMKTATVLLYLPWLLLSGIVFGLITGLTARALIKNSGISGFINSEIKK